jgi:acyl carrier protein
MPNPLESVIATFEKVVGVSEVEAESDFFEIGGHSLQVMEVISLLRGEYGLTVPARQFLRDACVSSVAAACVPTESE